MSAIIWVHADALSRHHPVFYAAPTDARPIYVWDADDIARRNWSLKRCVFVLECLADMGLEILQGRTSDVLTSLGADHIFTAATPDPDRLEIIQTLEMGVTVVQPDPFVTVPNGTDMGRFFRCWNKVKPSAIRPTSQGS